MSFIRYKRFTILHSPLYKHYNEARIYNGRMGITHVSQKYSDNFVREVGKHFHCDRSGYQALRRMELCYFEALRVEFISERYRSDIDAQRREFDTMRGVSSKTVCLLTYFAERS